MRCGLVRVFVSGMLCLHLFLFINLRGRIEQGYPDFTAFYTAATLLRHGLGHQLYNPKIQYEAQESFAGNISSRRGPLPYIHPPFEALIFLPLTLLPYTQAFMVWDLLALLALFFVACLLRRSVPTLRSIAPWKFVFASLAFFPIFDCLLQGQDSVLLLLLCTLGFDALKRETNFLAGCWFALGAFKFQWILPIIVLIVVWKVKRVAAGFAMVSLILAFVSIGLVGWQNMLHYPAYVLRVVNTPSFGGVGSEIMPNLRGLLTGWPWPFLRTVGSITAVSSAVILFLLAATKGRGKSHPQRLELQFSLAILVSGLIGWHTNAHDLALLILPLVLVTDYCVQTQAQEPAYRFTLLLPAFPTVISPLWIVLWFVSGHLNLMAITLLWWTWKIGMELARDLHLPSGVQHLTSS